MNEYRSILVVIGLDEELSEFQRSVREALLADARKAWSEFARAVPGAQGIPFVVTFNSRIGVESSRTRAGRADLIVLGTRGRANVRDLFFGSTVENVLKRSTCSVPAVKPHKPTQN